MEEAEETDCSQITDTHLNKIIGLKIITESTVQFKAYDFHGLKHLQELAISFNIIDTLPAGLFDDLKHLQQLVLNDNQIQFLPPDLLSKLTNLQKLSLSNNQLKALPENFFSGLTALKKLDLKNNLFSEEETARIKKELEGRTDLSLEI